jgi:hypothetical protein
LFGLGIYARYKNKIYLNTVGYYGISKPIDFRKKITDSLKIIPGFGIAKQIKNNIFSFSGFVGSFIYKPQNYIWFEIGNDKTFFGDGYRSLLLSDNSSPYPYFKTSVEIWKVKYIYMIAKQRDFDARYSNSITNLFPKYTYTHYLSFNLLKRFNFSMFETVVSSPYDSLNAHRGIELNYLNPVIFFRSIEMSLGSPDNVLVGFTSHIKLFKSTMIYGQAFIDEFIISHIISSDEYWDEKYGIQAGYKCYNTFGIKNLYTQIEINAVRPYTYSHQNPIRAYTNTLQPLAHPLGANFIEKLAIISYSFDNFFAQIKTVYSIWGDNDSLNYGHNPTISYASRIGFDNIKWLQGVKSSLKFLSVSAGIKKHNYIFSTSVFFRKSTGLSPSSNIYFQINIGKNLFTNYYDY